MNPLHSVGARLSLALVAVVAGALGVVYLIVVPSLERNLVHAKLAQLERAAPVVVSDISRAQTYDWNTIAQTAAEAFNTRVVVYEDGLPFADSLSQGHSQDVYSDPVALRAAQTGLRASGTLTRPVGRFAEVAVPAGAAGPIVLLTAPLHDSLGNVHLVQNRLIAAGILALLASLVVGFGGASVFARRIRRLERAADRIASGDFSRPVDDSGRDELGQLAGAFERMRRRLAQLDDARRKFIANASHELRTPIFSLAGFLELLTDEEIDEASRAEFLETMRGQVERLTKLATDLLNLSRLDAGGLRVELETIDLAALAVLLGDEFGPLAQTSGHPLALDLADERPCPARGDWTRALQIGRALVENALVHTPPGTEVILRARMGESASFEVEDHGPGVPEEHVADVFERFYRVEGAVASGSGLGLAIARELAERMSGRLELEVEPRRTLFRLSLTAAAAAGPFPHENVTATRA